MVVAPIVAMPSIAAASSDQAGSNANCVCGPKRVTVLLFDFADVVHRNSSTSEYYSGIVRAMNASFYSQSYQKMWIVGGEAYGWYGTSLRLKSLDVTTWEGAHSGGDTRKLEEFARNKAFDLHVSGYVFAVFAGPVWGWATGIPSTLTVLGETRWGLDTFMHEFGHNLGLPDLYNYADLKAEPVGAWDLMDSGDEELSAWSRWDLGWFSSDSIVKMYPARGQIALVESLDSASGIRMVRIQLPGASRWLLAETRRSVGVLKLVIYRIEGSIESGKGSIVLEAVMDSTSKPVFLDSKIGGAFIILESQSNGLRVKLTTETEGQTAKEAFDMIYFAPGWISDAWWSDRVQGLTEAKEALSKAWDSFRTGDFDAAKASAEKAIELAQVAKVPQSWYQFEGLRPTLGARLGNASAFKSEEAIHYSELAKTLLRNADGNFTEKNFDAALDSLLEANETLTKADEAERAFVESQVINQPIPVLAVVVASGVTVVVIFGLWRMTRRKAVPR
jgi:cellobiose-specific phosphotransferase system component IIA